MKKEKNYVIIGEFSQRMTRKCKQIEDGMRRERKLAVALGLALILGMTGCAGKEAAQEGASAEKGMQESEWEKEELVPAREKEAESVENNAEEEKEPEDEGQAVYASQGTEHLSGKVQNPQADGMTLAQTTLVDDDGQVTLLDMKDAKKIPVKFTEDMDVEHWTISGGGAGIDMHDAVVSDLKESMTVELEGYYDGETFMATKVIMEEDV